MKKFTVKFTLEMTAEYSFETEDDLREHLTSTNEDQLYGEAHNVEFGGIIPESIKEVP